MARILLRGTIALMMLVTALLKIGTVQADVKVAVASNFAGAAKALVRKYVETGASEPIILLGSSGKHAAQIMRGLNVDLLLAADIERPILLEQRDLTVKGSRVDYALGRLAFWWPAAPSSDNALDQYSVRAQLMREGHIAIANSKLAPYGRAAKQVLAAFNSEQSLNVDADAPQVKIVTGENIAQTFQFIKTGNAAAGFVARSQILDVPSQKIWLVPSRFHTPIRQQMVLLTGSVEARAFYDFILSPEGLAIILQHGYDAPQ